MPFDANSFVADYLKQKYHRPCITVMEGCCRRCLRGTPSGYNLQKKSIKQLMNDGVIDPYQIASAFHIGSAFHAPYFKDSVLNMKSEASPCKYPGNCDLKCVLCFSLIVNSDDVELDIWPGFKVHKACTSLCLFPGCQKRLPTLPAYLSLQRSTLMCETHKDSNAFQKLSISTATAVQERREAMSVKKPAHSVSVECAKKLHQNRPEQTTSSSVSMVASESVVKRTVLFKKPLGKAKADKFNERGKSRSIFNFFQTPRAAAAKEARAVQDDALKGSKLDSAPRRFLRDKETGEIYGEWRGDSAFHIETNELLFTKSSTTHGLPVKLDFSPPISTVISSRIEMQAASSAGIGLDSRSGIESGSGEDNTNIEVLDSGTICNEASHNGTMV
jgi:hypothetical protein